MINLLEPDPRMTWDEWGIHLAQEVAIRRSKDPSTKVGAYIADELHRPVSIGYNGFPRGADDDPTLLADRDFRLRVTVHAEINALANARRSVDGCTIYVWPMPPCGSCMAILRQFGIARVVAPKVWPERWTESVEAGLWVVHQCGMDVDLI